MSESNYWKRSIGQRVSRRSMIRGAGIAGVGLAGAALIGCGDGDSDTPGSTATATPTQTGAGSPTATATSDDPFAHVKRGGTLNGTVTGDPPTIDPYGNLSFHTKGTAGYVYSRLYKVGVQPDLNPYSALPEPDAAESAETEDGQTWIVNLRQGVTFHNKPPVDGRELTAEDVVFSFERLAAEDSPGRALVESAGWESVEAVDEHTVRFNLSAVSATFLEDIADTNRLYIMPVEADGGFNPAQEMIGTGPWVLEQYQPASVLEYSKNPDYFVEGKPFADGVRVAIVPEYAQSLAQFQAGNTHYQGINPQDVVSLRNSQPNVQWRGLQPALLSFHYFSPEDQEPDAPWRDERFRWAISMSQDRKAIMDSAYQVPELSAAGLEPAENWNNVIPAGWGDRWWLDPQSEAQGESRQYFEYNPDEARALIQAGGWEGLSFTYQTTLNAYGSTYEQVFLSTEDMIRQIGLDPQVESQDYSSTYITQTFRGNFQGMAFGYETPFPEVGGYFPRLFGNDPANHSRISDPEITELAEMQARELDEDQRREYIHEIQRINATNMYYVPNQAGAGTGWTAYRPELRGIVQTRGYGGATENLINFWLDT